MLQIQNRYKTGQCRLCGASVGAYIADAQRKVKWHDYKVCRSGLAKRGVKVITSGRHKVNGVYRKRYLEFEGRVAHPEGLKEVG
jgi:hypothetical protein